MQPDFSRDARIAPILTRIAQLPKKPRLLITIDGPCGSEQIHLGGCAVRRAECAHHPHG
ncbi:MAG: hypothetical protein ACLTXW_10515 [Christensenellales bacterium]